MKDKLPAKLRAVTLFLCCAVLTLLGGGARAEEEVETGARAAVLIERNTGMVLLCHNENEPLPMASTTKVMTALLALEKGNLDDVVTVGRNAYGVPGTSIYLNLGEHITLRNLLYGLLLASGNDAAVAIAEHIGGSVEGFVNLMNKRADELGMQDTVFVNCTGLPAAGQFSTAKDVSKMFRELIGHKKYFEYSGVWMEDFQHPGGRVTGLTNTNKLIRQYNGCDGGKTGYTSEAMHCLAATAKRGDMRLISVVVGGPDSKTRFDENKKLFDYGFANYESKVFVKSGEAVGEATVTGGKKDGVAAVAEKDLVVFGKKGEVSGEVRISCDKVKAPVRKGDAIGKAYVISDGETIAEINLLSAENVEKATLADIIFKIAENW